MRVSSRAPVAETLTKSWIVGAGQKQRRVQDGYPVAEPLGFLQPVGGEEDGHAALAQRGDELVYLTGRDRVEPGGGLVEEQHRRVVQQCPGECDPLTQALGQ
jgi:hypothetical protein